MSTQLLNFATQYGQLRDFDQALTACGLTRDTGAGIIGQYCKALAIVPPGWLPPSIINPVSLFTRLGDIEAKAPDWLVKNFWEIGTIGSVFGPSGHYKSFVVVELIAAIATGQAFYGHVVKKAGPVITIIGEGQQGYRNRFRALEIERKIDLSNAPIYVSKSPVLFGDPTSLEPALSDIRSLAEQAGKPVLITIDTLSRNLSGDENSSQDMPRFVQHITRLRDEFGCAVLVVHHSGYGPQERSRGHSSFKAALDREYQCVQGDDKTVRLSCTKSKETEAPDPMAFGVRSIALGFDDDDGIPVRSCILAPTEFVEAPKGGTAGLGPVQTIAKQALANLYRQYRANLDSAGRYDDEPMVSWNDWRNEFTKLGGKGNRFPQTANPLIKVGTVINEGGIYSLA